MENKLYVGLTNSGKTEKIKKVLEEKINNNNSIIILDTKHEYEEIFNNTGYEIIKFDLRNLDKSINYNPLNKASILYKENLIDEAIGVIINIGNIIFKTENSIDPFWDNSAKNLYASICLYLLETNKDLNIKEILKVTVSEFDAFKEYVEKQDVLSTISILGTPIIKSPTETRGGILSVLNQKMGYFAHRPQLLEKICISDKLNIKDKQVIIFNNLENPGFPNTILEIIMHSIMNTIYDDSLKCTFILDNYDTINNKDIFENLFNNSLSHNIETIVATRNIENIKNKDLFKLM